jgi:hypothetical protein
VIVKKIAYAFAILPILASSSTIVVADEIARANVVIVNETPYTLTKVAFVHKPSRSVEFQWIDPLVSKDDDGLWRDIARDATSTQSRLIKFNIDSNSFLNIQERNWWFVAFSFIDSNKYERVFILEPHNGQNVVNAVRDIAMPAAKTAASSQIATIISGPLGVSLVGVIFKVASSPNLLESRAGFKEKSLHPGDANGTVKLIISQDDKFRLLIEAPTGKTEGRTEFTEVGADFNTVLETVRKKAGSKEGDKAQ